MLGVVPEDRQSPPAILEIADGSRGLHHGEEKDKIKKLSTIDLEQQKIESKKLQEEDLQKILVTRREAEAQYREEFKKQRISRADYAATLREIKEEKIMIKQQLKALSK